MIPFSNDIIAILGLLYFILQVNAFLGHANVVNTKLCFVRLIIGRNDPLPLFELSSNAGSYLALLFYCRSK